LLPFLPGLHVAACCLLLAAGVRRTGEPLPWRVPLALLVLVLAIFSPALLAGGVMLPADALATYAPFSHLVPPPRHGNFLQHDLLALIAPSLDRIRADLAAGEWPLWNPYAGAGIGLLSDPQAQVGQPLATVALLFPVATALGVAAALRVFVALLFTWLLLRRQGVGEGPALAGALAWGLGGYMLLWLGWPLANTGCWLPAVLWAGGCALADGSRRYLAALVFAMVGLLLSGHPETVLYALALLAAFALAQLRALPPQLRQARGARWLLAAGLAGALVLPVVLPGLLAAGASERAAGLRARAAAASGERPATSEASADAGQAPLLRWLPVVAPNALGNSRFLHYWGPDNTNEDASGFVGTATLLLALVGLGAPRGGRFPQERLLQVAVVVAMLLLVLPAPLRGLADRLPLALQSTTYYHRLLLVVGFGLACLAAFALERVARGQVGRWQPLMLAVAVAAVIAWAYLGHPHPGEPELLAALREGWLRWQLRFAAVAAAAVAFGRGRRWVAPLLAAAIAGELLLAHGPANPAAPPRFALPPSPVLERMATLAGPARTLSAVPCRPTRPRSTGYGIHGSTTRCGSPPTPRSRRRSSRRRWRS
jgi:hypothetical protein